MCDYGLLGVLKFEKNNHSKSIGTLSFIEGELYGTIDWIQRCFYSDTHCEFKRLCELVKYSGYSRLSTKLIGSYSRVMT
jgi:hypothetical protein